MVDYKIIIAGFGGQGIVFAGSLLAYAGLLENKKVVGMVSYGVEVRGGTATSSTIIADDEIASPVIDEADIIIVLNQQSLNKYEDNVKKKAYLVVNTSLANREVKRNDIIIVNIDATNIANDLGDIKVANIVAIGALIKKSNILQLVNIKKALPSVLKGKQNLIEINEKALKKGAELCS